MSHLITILVAIISLISGISIPVLFFKFRKQREENQADTESFESGIKYSEKFVARLMELTTELDEAYEKMRKSTQLNGRLMNKMEELEYENEELKKKIQDLSK